MGRGILPDMTDASGMLAKAGAWMSENRWFLGVLAFIIALSLLPTALSIFALGSAYRGVPVSFTDSAMYKAHVAHVGAGYLSDGNPYYLEHAAEPALVIFLGDYLHAIPMLVGVPFSATLLINLFLFSVLFAFSFYALLRTLDVPRRWAVAGVVLLYLLFFSHIERPSNMEPFLPLLALFYIGLYRILEGQKHGVTLVASTLGAMFYFYSYLWQSFCITLGLSFLYALLRKKWKTAQDLALAGAAGAAIGIPSLLYIFWLSHASPYFWESLGRYGLVNTHLPMAEALYSGGWVGLALLFLATLFLFVKRLASNASFRTLACFLVFTGLGLWLMQVSNVLTGKLLENAQHMTFFITGWIIIFALALGALLWRHRSELGRGTRLFAAFGVLVFAAYGGYQMARDYLPTYVEPLWTPSVLQAWRAEEGYRAPLAWIDAHETKPVVIWEDPHDQVTWDTPLLSRDYVLFAVPGMWHLVPDGEIVERYLVAEYFENPAESDLKSDMALYLGRQWVFHLPKTIERQVKFCRLIHFYDRTHPCGTIPTAVDVIGEARFAAWEEKFVSDIKPHIQAYLAKYHVAYILKDAVLHPEYHPETLGAAKVYDDGRFQLWKLPQS